MSQPLTHKFGLNEHEKLKNVVRRLRFLMQFIALVFPFNSIHRLIPIARLGLDQLVPSAYC